MLRRLASYYPITSEKVAFPLYKLDRLLGVKLWEMSPLDAEEVRPNYNDAYAESWPQARELRGELERLAG